MSIDDCTMKTGDDCVSGFDNEHVSVRGCRLNTACSAFRFGGRDVRIENCRCWGPGDIVVWNCSLENAERFLHYNFSGNETWQRNRPLSSIRFENVEAHGVGMSLCAYGSKDRPFSLLLERCRIAFAGPQREFIRAAHVESLRLRDVAVEGVAGPCVRSWGGVAPVVAQGLSGVSPVIETADEPFHAQAI